MIDKRALKEYLDMKDYKEISKIFLDEYRELLSDFLEQNGIKVGTLETINMLINKVDIFFPNYSGVTKTISDFVNNEDITIYERINDMIDSYDKIVLILK